MAGISQVWLTEKELKALDAALTPVIAALREEDADVRCSTKEDYRHLVSGADKIRMALEPVACRV